MGVDATRDSSQPLDPSTQISRSDAPGPAVASTRTVSIPVTDPPGTV